MDSHRWLGLRLADPINVKVEYPTWATPTDAKAIAAATVHASVVIVYTLYDSVNCH